MMGWYHIECITSCRSVFALALKQSSYDHVEEYCLHLHHMFSKRAINTILLEPGQG